MRDSSFLLSRCLRPYATLQSKAVTDGKWDTIRAALGDEAGSAAINIAASNVFSSFLPVSSDELYHSLSKPVATEEVPVRRLDSFGEMVGGFRHILLKTDTQGFDLAVLRGAQGLLDRIEAIQVRAFLLCRSMKVCQRGTISYSI